MEHSSKTEYRQYYDSLKTDQNFVFQRISTAIMPGNFPSVNTAKIIANSKTYRKVGNNTRRQQKSSVWDDLLNFSTRS